MILIAITSAMALLLLTGCATGSTRVDSDVSAFARWPAGPAKPGSSYRFERLPSQQLPQALLAQEQLEAAAQAALAKVGLVLEEGRDKNASTAQFSVQVSYGIRQGSLRYRDAYDGALFGGGIGFGGSGVFLGGGSQGVSIGLGFPLFALFPERPEYAHALTLVVRERASGQVVFETTAQHESTTNNPQLLLPAMLEAALRGFPEPPAGMRRLSVQVLTAPG